VVIDNYSDEYLTVLTPTEEVFEDKAYRAYLQQIKFIRDGHKEFKDKVHNKALAGEKGPVEGKVRPKSFLHQMNHTLDLLLKREQLPALFFVFSRKNCEIYASKVERDFLTSSESARVRTVIQKHLHPYKSLLETLPQFHEIQTLLQKGIAFHHSGLLPMLKEIIEILFTEGLIKVLFATETFAVGLNMPTKTVVFTSLKKYDDGARGLRLLRTDEYTQMAGRAGRRGKDKEGLVILLQDKEPVEVSELQKIMKGSRQQVCSRMNFHYDFLLKTLNAGNTNWLTLMEQSYWFQQRLEQLKQNGKAIAAFEAKVLKTRSMLSSDQIALCVEKKAKELEIKNTGGNKYKKLQQEFMKWSVTNLSGTFPSVEANYETLKAQEKELAEERRYTAYLEDHATTMAPTVAFLRQTGYLKESLSPLVSLSPDDLTLKGTLATEINEGHPILMTELFLSKSAHTLSGAELAATLSVFLEDFNKEACPRLKDLQIPDSIPPILEVINTNAVRFGDIEYKVGAAKSEDDWNLSIQWLEPVYRWLTEEDIHIATLCQDYGTFEGNLVRGFLKLTNLLDEWTSMATFCEHADQLEKITEIKAQLVRGLVLPTSLYLRS
jgi:superfamily II RNA helicase